MGEQGETDARVPQRIGNRISFTHGKGGVKVKVSKEKSLDPIFCSSVPSTQPVKRSWPVAALMCNPCPQTNPSKEGEGTHSDLFYCFVWLRVCGVFA